MRPTATVWTGYDPVARRHYFFNSLVMTFVGIVYPFFYMMSLRQLGELGLPGWVGLFGVPAVFCAAPIVAKTTMGFRISATAIVVFDSWVILITLGMLVVLLSISC